MSNINYAIDVDPYGTSGQVVDYSCTSGTVLYSTGAIGYSTSASRYVSYFGMDDEKIAKKPKKLYERILDV